MNSLNIVPPPMETQTIQCIGNYQCQSLFADSLQSEGFSIKYDHLDEYIAVGCYNGTKIIYSVKERKIIERADCVNEDPVTCVKWRPRDGSKSNVLGVTTTAGVFQYYHTPSLKVLFTIEEEGNSLHCCDFSKTGNHFATAGKDCHIRIYDEHTKSLTTNLGPAEWNIRGHSNRIFAIKFIDDNTLISGGWDSVLHLWDVRSGKSEKAVFGSHVSGDAIDFHNDQILVGCYSAKQQIQLWDLKKWQMRTSIDWLSNDEHEKSAYVYTASFGKYDKNLILAGACGLDEAKIFHNATGQPTLSTVVRGLKGGCFSITSAHLANQFTLTTGKGGIFTYCESKK